MRKPQEEILDFQDGVEYAIGSLVRFHDKIVCRVAEQYDYHRCSDCYCFDFAHEDFCGKTKCSARARSDKNDTLYEELGRFI